MKSRGRLAAIALAILAGTLVAERSLPDAGEPPALRAPPALGPSSGVPAEVTPAARRAARAAAPRPLPTHFDDEAEPFDSRAGESGRRPETEAEHYRRFLATWRAGGAARRRLEERAPEVLRAPRASAEKVALLRALRDAGSDAVPELLELVLSELADVSGPRGVSVPAFVVRRLGQVRISAAERAVLERAVHDSSGTLAPNTRGRALRVLIESADENRRLALARSVLVEPDPLVRAMGAQALRSLQERKGLSDE